MPERKVSQGETLVLDTKWNWTKLDPGSVRTLDQSGPWITLDPGPLDQSGPWTTLDPGPGWTLDQAEPWDYSAYSLDDYFMFYHV